MPQARMQKFISNFIFDENETLAVAELYEGPDDGQKRRAKNNRYDINDFPLFKSTTDHGFFFCPNQIADGKARAETNLRELRWLFLDFDGNFPGDDKIFPAPHLKAFRGETGNVHLYFQLSPVPAIKENIERYKKIARGMARRFGADPAVVNPAGLIRVPYSTRWKNGEKDFYRVTEFHSATSYTLEELEKIFVAESEKPESAPGKSDFDVAAYIKQRQKRQPTTKQGEGRSRRLLALGYECRDWGLSLDDALKLALELNAEIFEPPETDSIVQHQIKSAYRYAKGEAGVRLSDMQDAKGKKETEKFFRRVEEEERVRGWLSRCVYIISILHLIDTADGLTYSGTEAINSYLRSVVNTGLPFAHILQKNLVRTYKKVDFRPDCKQEFRDVSGVLSFNRFKALPEYEKTDTKVARDAVKIFQEHIKYLTETPYENEAVLQFLAHTVQKPGQKIKHALLFINTREGTGRSWLADLMALHFGEYTTGVDHDNIRFGYTQYLVDKLLIFIHEIRDNDRFSFMDRFKSRITEKDILIEEKYSRSYRQTNTANFIFFSNHRDALKIENHDRRLLVILNEKPPQSEEYYNRLYGVLQNPEACRAIFNYLLSYDLSKYNPHKRPEVTRGKEIMIAANASELHLYLDDLRAHPGDNPGSGFETSFLNVRRLQQYVEAYGPAMVKHKASEKQLKNYLIEKGYEEKRVMKRFQGVQIHKTIWIPTGATVDEKILAEMVSFFDLAILENQEKY